MKQETFMLAELQEGIKVETSKSKHGTEKRAHENKPFKKGLFKRGEVLYNLSDAGRHEIALPL